MKSNITEALLHDNKARRIISDSFISFLYGAGINVVIVETIELRMNFFVLLLTTAFIFSDWTSRVLLTRRGDIDVFDPGILKNILDSMCIVTLILFCVFITRETSPQFKGYSPEFLFGFFLLVSAFWNFYIVHLYKNINLKDLGEVAFRGIRGHEELIQNYLNDFMRKVDQAVQNLNDSKASKAGWMFLVYYGRMIQKRGLELCVQLVAAHIAMANLLAGLILILKGAFYSHVPQLESIPVLENCFASLCRFESLTNAGICFFALIVICFMTATVDAFHDKSSRKFEQIDILYSPILCLFYLFLPSVALVAVMAFQQIAVNIFLHRFLSPKLGSKEAVYNGYN